MFKIKALHIHECSVCKPCPEEQHRHKCEEQEQGGGTLLNTGRPEAVADTMVQGGTSKSLSDAKHCL